MRYSAKTERSSGASCLRGFAEQHSFAQDEEGREKVAGGTGCFWLAQGLRGTPHVYRGKPLFAAASHCCFDCTLKSRLCELMALCLAGEGAA